MQILGIDYGKSKIGLALAVSGMAQPLAVIKVKSITDATEKIARTVGELDIEKVVVGVSAGKMKIETLRFAKLLQDKINVPVDFQDENFSSQIAQKAAIEAGIKQSKRKAMEDAFAASIILQEYLDTEGLVD